MNIKAFAEEHGISDQAIYQKLRRLKINAKDLTDNGQLTTEGLNKLLELYPERKKKESKTSDATADQMAELARLTAIVEQLEIRIKEKDKRIEELNSTIEFLKTQIPPRLPEGKPTIWQRLFKKKE